MRRSIVILLLTTLSYTWNAFGSIPTKYIEQVKVDLNNAFIASIVEQMKDFDELRDAPTSIVECKNTDEKNVGCYISKKSLVGKHAAYRLESKYCTEYKKRYEDLCQSPIYFYLESQKYQLYDKFGNYSACAVGYHINPISWNSGRGSGNYDEQFLIKLFNENSGMLVRTLLLKAPEFRNLKGYQYSGRCK